MKKVIKTVVRTRKRRGLCIQSEIETAARKAAEIYLNPEFLKGLDEPVGLASGKLSKSGTFVHEDDEDENY